MSDAITAVTPVLELTEVVPHHAPMRNASLSVAQLNQMTLAEILRALGAPELNSNDLDSIITNCTLDAAVLRERAMYERKAA